MESENFAKRIEEIERMVKENNHMLHKMRRAQMWASLMRTLYWLVILGFAGAVYYYLKPILTQLFNIYASLGDQFLHIKNLF